MVQKEFRFRGKTFEDIAKLDVREFALLLPARERRSLMHGMSHPAQKLLKHIKDGKKKLRTHARDMVILPSMVGCLIHIHSGKDWVPITVDKDMIGHRLGEFAITTKRVEHSAPGIGATRSSAALSVR